MPFGQVHPPNCLKPLLETNNICPVCRFELPKKLYDFIYFISNKYTNLAQPLFMLCLKYNMMDPVQIE